MRTWRSKEHGEILLKRKSKKMPKRMKMRNLRRKQMLPKKRAQDMKTVPDIEESRDNLFEEPVEDSSYSSLFSPDSDSAKVRVDAEIWSRIKENVPDDYLIPDPLFMELITTKYREGLNKQR